MDINTTPEYADSAFSLVTTTISAKTNQSSQNHYGINMSTWINKSDKLLYRGRINAIRQIWWPHLADSDEQTDTRNMSADDPTNRVKVNLRRWVEIVEEFEVGATSILHLKCNSLTCRASEG